MTNFDKICKYLEYGLIVRVCVVAACHTIISVYENELITDRGHGFTYSSKSAINSWGEDGISITPIARKPKLFEVGHKVQVLGIANQVGDCASNWNADHRRLIGQTDCEIVSVNDTCEGVFYAVKKHLNDYLDCVHAVFPAWCLAPVFEEEEKMVEIPAQHPYQRVVTQVDVDPETKAYIFPISVVKKALVEAEGRVK